VATKGYRAKEGHKLPEAQVDGFMLKSRLSKMDEERLESSKSKRSYEK
jgi:hypothetical protein